MEEMQFEELFATQSGSVYGAYYRSAEAMQEWLRSATVVFVSGMYQPCLVEFPEQENFSVVTFMFEGYDLDDPKAPKRRIAIMVVPEMMEEFKQLLIRKGLPDGN